MVISAACAGVLLHAARATTNVIMTTSVRFMTSSEVCRILSRTAHLEKFFDPGTKTGPLGPINQSGHSQTRFRRGELPRRLLGSRRFKEFQVTLLQIAEL